MFMLAAVNVGVLCVFFGFFYAYFRMLVELFNLLMEPLSTGLGYDPQFFVVGISCEHTLVILSIKPEVDLAF